MAALTGSWGCVWLAAACLLFDACLLVLFRVVVVDEWMWAAGPILRGRAVLLSSPGPSASSLQLWMLLYRRRPGLCEWVEMNSSSNNTGSSLVHGRAQGGCVLVAVDSCRDGRRAVLRCASLSMQRKAAPDVVCVALLLALLVYCWCLEAHTQCVR